MANPLPVSDVSPGRQFRMELFAVEATLLIFFQSYQHLQSIVRYRLTASPESSLDCVVAKVLRGSMPRHFAKKWKSGSPPLGVIIRKQSLRCMQPRSTAKQSKAKRGPHGNSIHCLLFKDGMSHAETTKAQNVEATTLSNNL